MTRRILPLLMLGLLFPSPALPQEPGAAAIVAVRVGIEGFYKAGLWTPVVVTVRAGSQPLDGRITLTAPDGDGVPTAVRSQADEPCQVPAGESREFELYVRFGRVRSELAVEFATDSGPALRRVFTASDGKGEDRFPAAVANSRPLVVVVGAEPAGVEDAYSLLRLPAKDQIVIVRVDDAARLPLRWYGYESVDTVVLTTSQLAPYRTLKSGSRQLASLGEWIEQGGKVLFCVGQQGAEVLAADAPLAGLAPGKLQRMATLPQTGALEAYAGSSMPVPAASVRGRHELRVPQLTAVSGRIEAREADLPLVVRQARRLGVVVFLAADPERKPLSGWSDRGMLVGKLLNLPAPAADIQESRAILQFGYSDLAGQLRSALDHFPHVRLDPKWTFWTVLGLALVFLILVGPGDYALLRGLIGRMGWTWLTFPLVVVAFGAGAYALATWSHGRQSHANQINLLDVAPDGRVRGTTWANLFNPQSERYDVSFLPRGLDGRTSPDASRITAWLGLPGNALGGMDAATVGPGAWREGYEYSASLDTLQGMPMRVWSTKSLTARWNLDGQPRVASELADRDGLPEGTVTNPLPFPLADCVLAYGRWAYELGTLRPGQSAEIGPLAVRRELETLLTGRKLEFSEGELPGSKKYRMDTRPLYDQSSTDPAYVLRAMLFYGAAGGRRYAGLANQYQGFVDLSGLLKTDRAILMARAPEDVPARTCGGAELLVNGEPAATPGDRAWTFYRFVLPVTPEKP